jgi:hypothetical protein
MSPWFGKANLALDCTGQVMIHASGRVASSYQDGNRPLNTRGPYFGSFLRAMPHGPRDNPWDKQTLSAFTRRNLLVSGRCGNLTSSINRRTCHCKNICWTCSYSLRAADAGIVNRDSMNRFPRSMLATATRTIGATNGQKRAKKLPKIPHKKGQKKPTKGTKKTTEK